MIHLRNPNNVLNSLTEHSSNKDYKYQRLYRLLFNNEMYFIAYQKIYAKEGNMTRGSDNRTIDNMSLRRIDNLISSLKDESYQPKPARREYIPKKNGKMRPLGIPSFEDKLLQEVVRMLLESIYEGYFEPTSHGFRPKCSCHTALTCIETYYTGSNWFIEGDIKSFFDEIDHNIMIDILRERISDERFLRLIRKFLKAGYIEDWQFYKTYSGTPQGGIISPILANIYLDKLDKYMKEYADNFNKGQKRQVTKEYSSINHKRAKLVLKMKKATDESAKKEILSQIKSLDKQRLEIPSVNYMDENFKRLKYERYADDFLIGVIGSKEDCKRIKSDIKEFLKKKLNLELSDEKTLITHTSKSARFLGYDISVRRSNGHAKYDKRHRLCRTTNGKVVLKIPMEIVKRRLLDYKAMVLKTHNHKEFWKPVSRDALVNNDDLEILRQFNAELTGFYNYYSLALNIGVLNNFKHIMQYSMFKTLANKYRTSKTAIIKRMRIGKDFGVRYSANGKEKIALFYSGGFGRKKLQYGVNFDVIPNTAKFGARTSLIDRLSARVCEYCGKTDVDLYMHHVRKLKSLKGKEEWEQFMIARKRKTLAVCDECHRKIHNGKMD